MSKKPFWETKTLTQMNASEWESLCDGCGLCCLIRFEEETSGEITPTRVHCKLFDPDTCRCSDYALRKKSVPDCIKLTPNTIKDLPWMPLSCAYRRLYEGKSLPKWHYLITGDRESVHEAGVSIRGQTINELALGAPEEALDFAAYDLNEDRSDWEPFED